ncbi:MAG: flagellar hook-basal body complex protein FliE [Planctomycetes bacterium]|nr:flagellar hook-basal body complex protein FliE [Planctomycetota bacterium]
MREGPWQQNSEAGVAPAPENDSFRDALLQSLARVAELQEESERVAGESERGTGSDVVDLLAAVRKAGEAFDTLMRVRHQILTAYARMQERQRPAAAPAREEETDHDVAPSGVSA